MSGRTKRGGPIKIRYDQKWQRIKPAKTVTIDWRTVAALREVPVDGTRLPVTGHCHDCDRRVSGERRFCGPCFAKHDRP